MSVWRKQVTMVHRKKKGKGTVACGAKIVARKKRCNGKHNKQLVPLRVMRVGDISGEVDI